MTVNSSPEWVGLELEKLRALDRARIVCQDFDEEDHEGVSVLRRLNSKTLGPSYFQRPMVLHHRSKPVAVLVPYELFMRAQEAIIEVSRELAKQIAGGEQP